MINFRRNFITALIALSVVGLCLTLKKSADDTAGRTEAEATRLKAGGNSASIPPLSKLQAFRNPASENPKTAAANPVWECTPEYVAESITSGPRPASQTAFEQLGIQALNDADPTLREYAVTELCISETDEAIPFLVTALRDPEPRVWQRSMDCLRKFINRFPVEPLMEMAAFDSDQNRREQVLILIREITGHRTEEMFPVLFDLEGGEQDAGTTLP